jgi:RsiW-degrading membrane proteinase PrsW (M82 family)
MADGISVSFLAVLIVSAFTLPLLFLIWIRNTERFGREPWAAVLRSFLSGAVLSVLIAILFSLVLLAVLQEIGPVNDVLSRRFLNPEMILGALIVAPLVEEAAKVLGARSGRPHTDVRVDGIVYGAAAGLGFSATENLFYGLAALAEGTDPSVSLVVIAFRSFSSSFLHASATAVAGYGLAKGWLTGRWTAILPFYFVAVLMHAVFNFLASLGELYAAQVGDSAHVIGFAAAAAFAVGAVSVVRFKLASQRHPGAG